MGAPQTSETPKRDGADRRVFLASAGMLAASTVWRGGVETPVHGSGPPSPPSPSSPPSPPTDDHASTPRPIDRRTIAEAERLAGVRYTDAERDLVLDGLDTQIERSVTRRSFDLANGVGPAQVFDPGPSAGPRTPAPASSGRSWGDDPGPVPADDEDIAFAPVTALSAWIRRRELTSERLTEIYLARLARLGPRLECVVTLTDDLARAQAAEADRDLAAGRVRGPLHGIPWGAKDLLDTAGIRTTWGAAPYRDRVAESDAVVVTRLREAGAVLAAKLSLGALAYGDIWFDGKTRSPWNAERGSSGSSAGSAAATGAGLVGFSLGTETYGSIVSPCMRCGTTGLRPTFGRVARTGAMALCWSLDKIGPITRTVADTALVLAAINGADAGDPSSRSVPFRFDARRPVAGLRIGYDPAWFEGEQANAIDRAALDAARDAGLELVEVTLPDWPYESLLSILFAEAAAAFEELTLTDADDQLAWQEPQAWPNTFRQARFISAIDYVQAERLRRRVGVMMAERFDGVDALLSPSFAAALLLITSNTGHPSLTLRAGFTERGEPHGVTLWGRLFDEGTLCSIGMALEEKLGVWERRPVPLDSKENTR